jgi:choline-glycine betaine transporter
LIFFFFFFFFFFSVFLQRAVQFEARAKWDAWNALKGTSKEAAMQKYIDLLSKGDANWEAHTALANYKD